MPPLGGGGGGEWAPHTTSVEGGGGGGYNIVRSPVVGGKHDVSVGLYVRHSWLKM